VHGRGFEYLIFGANGGVVHGRGFECFTFGVNGSVVYVVGSNLCLSHDQWSCSAWSWFESRFLGSMVV
jgi:hypothetical protein